MTLVARSESRGTYMRTLRRFTIALDFISRLKLDVQLPHIRCKAIPTLLPDLFSILTVRKAHLKQSNQIRRDAAQFVHSQFLPHAIVHAGAERHEGAFVDDFLRLLVCPTLGQKLQRFGKVARIALDGVDGHPDDDATWYVYAGLRKRNALGRGFALNT